MDHAFGFDPPAFSLRVTGYQTPWAVPWRQKKCGDKRQVLRRGACHETTYKIPKNYDKKTPLHEKKTSAKSSELHSMLNV